MLIRSKIRKLRIVSFLLFLTPALALVASLFAHNYLVSFNYKSQHKFNFSCPLKFASVDHKELDMFQISNLLVSFIFIKKLNCHYII